MGFPMMHGHGSSDWGQDSGMPRVLFVPAPMAAFGVLIAFMFGMTLGMVVSGKRERMAMGGMHMGMGGMGMGGPCGKGMMGHGGWKSHHHHGYGAPPCKEQHEGWPPAKDMSAGEGAE